MRREHGVYGMCCVRTLIVVATFALGGISTAIAGCANYTDGSVSAAAPRAIICFKDKCDKTKLDFECGNVSGAQFGYQIGWYVSYEKEEVSILWKGKRVNRENYRYITCYPIDDDACKFPDEQNHPLKLAN